MGGRGASSGGGGSGGMSSSLRNAIGAKGKPLAPEQAAAGTNPKFNSGYDYRVNCQRCVYAYELRRRGYNVEAQPRPKVDSFPWKNGFNGQQWEGNLGRTRKTVESNIGKTMDGWGDGSRGVLYVVWNSGRSAHVFNVERRSGKTEAYDAQSGKRVNLTDYLARAKPTRTMISRIDNLQPSDSLVNAVKKKGASP